jgi:hypothetical protein
MVFVRFSVPVNSQTAGTMVDQGRMVNPRSERRPFDSVPVNTQTADTTVTRVSVFLVLVEILSNDFRSLLTFTLFSWSKLVSTV